MGKFIDLTGKRFNRLLVIKKHENKQGKEILWVCKCNCGKETLVMGSNLKRGTTKSCGCLRKDYPKLHFTKQIKKDNERVYSIWECMKARCNNKNRPNYKDYGGRGIKLYYKWETFEGFWEDMHKGYSDKLTIERINVNGNYEPSNCKWATYIEQANNRRNSRLITYNGETDTLPNLCRKYNKNVQLVHQRIYRDKKDIETAFSY